LTAALPPVIAIDGPSASGKGTVAREVARSLGFRFLDSGALYRLVGLAALERGIELGQEPELESLALGLDARFIGDRILLEGRDVTEAIRDERVGAAASTVAALQRVRAALLASQRAFREWPGLVADGRDMGSVVFPDATLKVFLTAAPAERARRRHKQLMEKGLHDRMGALLQEIHERDERDAQRAVAPLRKCPDARELDTTHMSVEAAVHQVLAWYSQATQAP
jgi:cytidylate kinase